MAVLKSENIRETINKLSNPLKQHMLDQIQADGRTIDDLESILIRGFSYDDGDDGMFKKFKPAPVYMYEFTYKDHSTNSQWWTKDNGFISYEQVKEIVEIDLLVPEDRFIFNK